jgi:UDP-N-acetyl-D-glucosamine dehydrogenase
MAGLRERGAELMYHDPHVPTFRLADGSECAETGLDELLSASDVVVIVTPHKAIDWDAVFTRAELIVDTTDSSRGRPARERQVLRLGAGWAVRP